MHADRDAARKLISGVLEMEDATEVEEVQSQIIASFNSKLVFNKADLSRSFEPL